MFERDEERLQLDEVKAVEPQSGERERPEEDERVDHGGEIRARGRSRADVEAQDDGNEARYFAPELEKKIISYQHSPTRAER